MRDILGIYLAITFICSTLGGLFSALVMALDDNVYFDKWYKFSFIYQLLAYETFKDYIKLSGLVILCIIITLFTWIGSIVLAITWLILMALILLCKLFYHIFKKEDTYDK